MIESDSEKITRLEARVRELEAEVNRLRLPVIKAYESALNNNAVVAQAMQAEIERLKRGDFTAAEFQNLCHNLPEHCTRAVFKAGCEAYQEKLFGKEDDGQHATES